MALLLALCLLGGLNIDKEATAVHAQNSPAEMLAMVNQVRANYGLPPYQWNSQLAAAAQNQANFMATNNVYTHSGSGGSTPQTRALAAGYIGRANENIVGGTGLTAKQGVVWWQNSPIHFNTMISKQYIEAGIAVAQGHDQNFYALVVGAPTDSAPVAAAPRTTATGDEPSARVEPIVLTNANEDGSIVHTVLPGHTFWAIAARYEITIAELFLFNNLNDKSIIHPGNKLTIRLADGQEPPPTPTPPATHVIRDGETPWTIAATYRLSLDEFYWLNGLTEYDMLHPGNEVKIRLVAGEEPPPTPTPQLKHIIRSGDTLWGIAIRYGLALDQLLKFNDIGQNAVLSIGNELLIVPPTPLPSPTPPATATPPPTATAVPATKTPVPTATATALAVSLANVRQKQLPEVTAVPQSNSSTWQSTAGSGLLILGILLLLLAIVALVIVRRSI